MRKVIIKTILAVAGEWSSWGPWSKPVRCFIRRHRSCKKSKCCGKDTGPSTQTQGHKKSNCDDCRKKGKKDSKKCYKGNYPGKKGKAQESETGMSN